MVLNKLYLFKGFVEYYRVGQNNDFVSSENNNNFCSEELIGSQHMVCLTCTTDIHAVQPEKIACLQTSAVGSLTFGPVKGLNLDPNLRLFCPEGSAFLPPSGSTCTACTNPNCRRCAKDNLNTCLGCAQGWRLDGMGSCTSSSCATNQY